MRRSSLLPCIASVVALTALGCRTPSSKIPLESLAADTSTDASGESREAVEPLAVEGPSDLLPAEVPVLAEAIDPAAVLALLAPLDNEPFFSQARAELARELGGDLLDASQWDALGLDSHAPAGIGLLDIGAAAGFAYLSLTDEARFEATLRRFATMVGVSEQMSSLDVGWARVHRLNREVHVVVRERVALLMIVLEPERALRDYVVGAATIDPRDSLGRSARFGWARSQLLDADDGMLFIDPKLLLGQIDRERQADSDYGIRYAEEELARARSLGGSAELIRELEQRVEEERRWQSQRAQQDQSRRALGEVLFASVETFVAAADLRDDGITGHAFAKMAHVNILRRLFVAPEHESPLLTALDEAPLFLIDGRLDLQVGLELFELLLGVEGQTLANVNAELMSELGVDLIGGLIPSLTGEGGIAVTQAGKPDSKRLAEVPKTLGLVAQLGLRDPEPIRRLLDGLARDKRVGGALTRSRRGDGWTLTVPAWRALELTIVGDRLLVSSDAGVVKRVRAAERGALATQLSPAHPLQGPSARPVQRLYGRWVGLVIASAREPWAQDAAMYLYDFDSHPVLSVEQAAQVPYSKAFKQKRAELDRALAQLDRYNQVQARERFEADLKLAESVGDVGLQLELVSDGIMVTGQWRFAPGASPAAIGYQGFIGGGNHDWAEYDRLNAEVYTLSDELRTIRQTELDNVVGATP
jgi:hypothetical protein